MFETVTVEQGVAVGTALAVLIAWGVRLECAVKANKNTCEGKMKALEAGTEQRSKTMRAELDGTIRNERTRTDGQVELIRQAIEMQGDHLREGIERVEGMFQRIDQHLS